MKWSDEEIARAIRYGIHKSGRALQFMPSGEFSGLSIEDTAALVAYIRKAQAVPTDEKKNSFGPVSKILSFFGKMPILFPAKFMDLNVGFNKKPMEGPSREFGQYLANSCTGCHGQEFRGGKMAGDPSWPDATNLRFGANSSWTEADFRMAMKEGVSPFSKQKIRAPMPVNLTAQMNDVEIKALWEYFASLK